MLEIFSLSLQELLNVTVNYIGWSKERGFYHTAEGAYVKRSDYEALQQGVPLVGAAMPFDSVWRRFQDD